MGQCISIKSLSQALCSFILFVLLMSCGNRIYGPYLISYHLVDLIEAKKKYVGDFQKILLTNTDSIYVSPVYYKQYGNIPNSYQIAVRLRKQLSLEKQIACTSKNFGSIPFQSEITNTWPEGYHEIIFVKKLGSLERQTKLDSIYKDIIELKIGKNEQLLFDFEKHRISN